MKVKIDKNCSMIVYLLIFLFSFFSFSCDNPLIQEIVGAKTANFESNGGSSVESQTVFRDQPVKKPSNPSKIDHTFAAWYCDNNTFEQEWDFAAIPNADITLYAKWIVDKTVTGIAIKTPQTKMSYAHGETLDLSGLAVTLTYDDATTADVAFSNFASRGITTSPAHGTVLSRSTHNNSPVTVTYGSFAPLTTNNLTVNPKVMTFTVDSIPTQPYTGSAITPSVTVRDGATTLTLTTDYTVAYTNNTNAGTANVTVSGAGNYAGSSGTATFVISNAFITSAAITVTSPVKGGTPVTTAGGTGNFTVGTVSWSPNNNPFAGGTVYTASVTLTANANYAFAALTGANATINGINAAVSNNTGNTVTLSHTFAATETKAVTGITIKTQPTKLTYTHGEALNLSGLVVTLSHDDTTTEDVALSAFASKNISVSPANGVTLSHSTHDGSSVTVTYGSFTQTIALTVNPRVITFNVSAIAAQNYTGSAITPTVTVRDGTTTLTLTTDYTVTYTNNTNAGTATVTVSGAGNYAGSTGSTTFTINKINPTVTWPTGLTATYGQTLSAITLPGNTGGTAGSFSWTEDGTTAVGNVGTRTHNMTFTPTDAANYNTLTQNVNITVNKAEGAVVNAPTAETISVTSVTLNAITIPDQNVEFAYNTTNTAPTSGWQTNRTFSGLTGGTTYYFFARSAENSNFNAGTPSAGTAITTTQNIGITVTIDASELQEKAPTLENTLILSRTASGGYQKTASVAITGTYQSINWEIFGPTSVSGTTSPITLNAEDVRYNSLGYHTVTVTVTVNGLPYPYQTNFRFRIVE